MLELMFDSLEPATEPVKISGKDYILKEIMGDAAAKYRNAEAKVIMVNQGTKMAHIDGAGDLFPLLVSLCLFEVYDDKQRPVTLLQVKQWPDKVIVALYKAAKKLNPNLVGRAVDADDKEEVKNSPDAMTGGSV